MRSGRTVPPPPTDHTEGRSLLDSRANLRSGTSTRTESPETKRKIPTNIDNRNIAFMPPTKRQVSQREEEGDDEIIDSTIAVDMEIDDRNRMSNTQKREEERKLKRFPYPTDDPEPRKIST